MFVFLQHTIRDRDFLLLERGFGIGDDPLEMIYPMKKEIACMARD